MEEQQMIRKTIPALVVLCITSLTPLSLSHAQEVTGYSMPLAAPEYGAPPRRFFDSKVVTITFKTTPETLKRLVPKPLVPNPDNLVSVYFGRFNTPDYTSGEFLFKGDSYLEVGFVVPTTLSNKSGGYSLFLYLNKPGPAISGREIWGYPKKDADIVMLDEKGKITFTVERLGTTIMKATFLRGEKVEPLPSRPPRVRYNLKYIPSVRKNAPPDVMQITSNVQENTLKELYKGTGTLELGTTPVDPLGTIPILEIVRAELGVIDGVVDNGDVLFDYLKQGIK
jgi:acetoacetate decarboxylase